MKVLVCDNLDEASLEKIRSAGIDLTYKTGMKPEELKKTIGPYDAVVVRSATRITKDVIETAKNLKLIVRAGVGLDNIDSIVAKEKNIEVRNTPEATTASVAELTLGLMLAVARHIPQGHFALKHGKWERAKYAGSELSGKMLGLIGFGRIGQEVARRAIAFGMDVIAFDPIISRSVAETLSVRSMELDELLKIADYISLHLPLTAETKGLLGRERIAMMKKTARLVNCARGGIIDEAALADALCKGRIAGAAFDVFEKEPPDSSNPLLACDNFIGIPHLGASTTEGQLRAGAEVAKIIINFKR